MKPIRAAAIAAAFAVLNTAAPAHRDHEHGDPLAQIESAPFPVLTPFPLELPEGLPDTMTIKFTKEGKLQRLELTKYSVRGENFRVLETDGAGGLREIDPPPVRTYRGGIAGDPGSQVIGIVTDEGLSAEVVCGDGKCWNICQPCMAIASHSWYVLSNAEVLSKLEGLPASAKHPLLLGSALALPREVTVKQAEIGFDLDYPTWSRSGSGGFDRNDAAAVAKMEEFVAVKLNSFVISNCLVEHVVGTIVLRKSAAEDPYDGMSNAYDILPLMRNVWNGSGNTGFPRPSTTHHLATGLIGRGMGGVAGLGYVGTVNEGSRYTIGTTTSGSGVGFWFNGVCKHEVAHNWGLGHGGCGDEKRPVGDDFTWSMCGGYHERARSDEASRAIGERDSSGLPDIGAYSASNQRPYCPKDTATVSIGGDPVRIDVLRNDYDANNDPFELTRFTVNGGTESTSSAEGAALAISDGTGPGGRDELLYTPPATGVPGSVDVIHYFIVDDTGHTSWGQLKVTLQPSTQPKPVNPRNYLADTALDFRNDQNPVTRSTPDGEGTEPEWSYGSFVGGSTTLSLATGNQSDGANVVGDENVGWIGASAVRIHKHAVLPSAANGEPAVKRWHSDYDGEVAVLYDAIRLSTDGDGQRILIHLNGEQVFRDTLNNGDPHTAGTLFVDINSGDTLDFIVDGLGSRSGDWTHFTGRVIKAEQVKWRAADDPVLHYKFDAAGTYPPERKTVAADHSGDKNYGAMTGFDHSSTRAAAQIENGLLFDGVDAEIRTPQPAALQGARAITIAAWVNPQTLGDNRGIITSLNDADVNLSYTGLLVGPSADGHPAQFRVHRAGINAPANSLEVGRWTHLVGTWQEGDAQRLYVNGALVAEDTTPPSGALDTDHWITGRDREIDGRYWQGSLDDIAIFDRALSEAEVAAMHDNGRDFQSYDGNGQHERIDSPRYADGSDEATLSAWVRAGSLAEHRGILTTWTEDDFPGDPFERSYFALSVGSAADGLPAQFRAHRWVTQGLPGSFPIGRWVHIAGVWKAGVEQSMYVDGVKVAQHPNPSDSLIDIGGWVIARNELSDNRYFDGDISEPLVLARALDANEIGKLHAAGRTNFTATEGTFSEVGQIGAQTGTHIEASGFHTTSTRGNRISGTAGDSFHFASTPHNFSGEVTVKLEALNDTGSGSKLGIMFRQDRSPGSPFVMFWQYGDGRLSLRSRFDPDGPHDTHAVMARPPAYPLWLRLARDDDHYFASYSEDGENWQFFADAEVDMPGNALVGVAHQSHSSGIRSIASFSGFEISDEITAVPDSDSDGLLDSWELDHFGDLTQDAEGDPDGDRRNNLLERFHGTHPNSVDRLVEGAAIVEITGDLIPPDADWLYLDDGSNQGSAWRSAAFDDSAWASGPAPLGYGEANIATPIRSGPSAQDRHITTYFRQEFEVGDPNALESLQILALRDDGIAVYLNGSEIGRDNLPAGAGFDTEAIDSLSGLSEDIPVTFPITNGDLLSGRNLIAAEVHQASPGSSDKFFQLQLTADLAPGVEEGTFLAYRFPRAKDATDLVPTIQTSADLRHWVDDPAAPTIITDLGDTEIVEVQVPYPPGVNSFYLRIVVRAP